jgi:protein-S-isoprenylcysteine O-methyltransferase Ste14
LLIYSTTKIPLLQTKIISSRAIIFTITVSLFILGIIFVIWSNINLFRIGKGGPTDGLDISISPRTKKLVKTGPYRYTRNPMVFGVHSLYFAWAVYLNTLVTLLFVTVFFLVAVLYLKVSEEKRLLRDFGGDFIEYREQVSMIIPWWKKKAK